MSRIWFTADPHFGHRNILQLCDRPFTSVEEMDDGLIDRWNRGVGPDDVVWVLGDYAMGDRSHGLGYLSRLAGKKRLVTGNHDDCGRQINVGVDVWSYTPVAADQIAQLMQ